MTAIGFDCESWLIRPARLAPPVVCITTAVGSVEAAHKQLFARADGRMRDAFEYVLRDHDPVYGVNVAYDMCCALREWPDLFHQVFEAYDDDRVIDVALSQQLIDNAKGRMEIIQHTQGYSLAALEKRWLKRDRSAQKDGADVWRLRYRELHDVPTAQWPKEAVEYALADAEGALLIGEAQWNSEDRKYLADSPAQARAGFALQLMMCWGVKTDPDKIKRLRAVASETYERVSVGLVAAGLVRADGTRNVRLAQARMLQVCKESGLRPKLTDAGYEKLVQRLGEKKLKDVEPENVFTEEEMIQYLSVDEDACNESGDQLLKDYTMRTQLHNILNTHVPDLLKGVKEPIQPRYITMVESGRTACAKSRAEGRGKSPTNGFQFQNPKRALAYFPQGVGIRECFEARPGKLFADNDFSGLELCTVAQVCLKVVGHSKLAEILNAGRDPHLQFGAKLLRVSYEEALSRKHEKEVKFNRQLAKVWNFGKWGGLGVRGMVGFARGYGVKLTLEDCRKYNDEWAEEFPESVDYFKWGRAHIDRISGRGEVEQLFVKRVRGGVTFTSGLNTMFQGLGADGAKKALYEVQKRCYVKEAGSVLYGVRPVGFIHDEILAEVDEALAHEQAFEMAKVMVDACNTFLPDVPVKCVPALSKRWSKDAEAIFDKNGRLQPYDLAREGRWKVYWDANAQAEVKWA